MTTTPQRNPRLDALDVARFIAFSGMVWVNFAIVTQASPTPGPGAFVSFVSNLLQGKAAATFVVLAGVGLGLMSNSPSGNFASRMIRRASFLFCLGMVNAVVFQADIIHYYAVYFLIALVLVPLRNELLWCCNSACMLGAMMFIMLGDYDSGWNWQALEYLDFWQPNGFLRNLWLNGWHPVLPWLCFLILGIIYSRIDLRDRNTQRRLFGVSLALLVLIEVPVQLFQAWNCGPQFADEVCAIVSTSPIPPGPLFVIAGSAAASLCICGILLLTGSSLPAAIVKPLARAGRQALTLYLMHIWVGMALLEYYQITGISAEMALALSIGFSALALVLANIWARFFRFGLFEYALRMLSR